MPRANTNGRKVVKTGDELQESVLKAGITVVNVVPCSSGLNTFAILLFLQHR